MSTFAASLLQMENLHVSYPGPIARIVAVDGADLHIGKGEILGLAGESGSGKSTIAFGVLNYLGAGRIDAGRVVYDGKDITSLDALQMRLLRAQHIALVPQDPLASLNPVMRIEEQLTEGPRYNDRLPAGKAMQQARAMLAKVRLDDRERILHAYPHQLSGGQQQRVLIAMALLAKPDLLLLDEPTTGLDASVQADIVSLIGALVREQDLACLFVSHDLELLSRICDRLAIMRAGKIVETGSRDKIMTAPEHPYTRALLAARPGPHNDRITNPLRAIKDQPQESAKIAQPKTRGDATRETAGPDSGKPVLQIENLSKIFTARPPWFAGHSRNKATRALANVSFDIFPGETLAIVGESGSGKSTLAKILLGLERPDTGTILLNGQNIAQQPVAQRSQAVRHAVQMVFQNPASTLNPSHTIGYQLERALACAPQDSDAGARFSAMAQLLDAVRLDAETARKKPAQLSGGQKQRVAIARALAANPRILVADEPVSALDVSVQAAIVELLVDIQRQFNLTLVFISHDLPLVRYLADRVAVMRQGEIVEIGTVQEVFKTPCDAYTRTLLESAGIQTAVPK